MSKKFRSKFEEKIAKQIKREKVDIKYEEKVIKYHKPITYHRYTPDFQLSNGIILETKGRLTLDDRKKMILVRDQNPELDIRFVFQAPNNKIYKGSKTTYADWANKNGFKWADKVVPKSWFNE